jgi:1,4-dihydroxy-2-naphthoyl-CoA hydrolase
MNLIEMLENLQNLPLEERARRIHGFRNDTLGLKLGIEVTSVSLERIEATMPVQGNVQPFGRLHGGANVVLAEELASIGSVLNLDLRRELAVGVDINATHVRGVTVDTGETQVRGVASLVYRGRSSLVWNIEIFNEQDKLTCLARCTCAVIPLPARG